MSAAEMKTHTVTVVATYRVYDGYGGMGEYLVRGMARAGARVNVHSLIIDTDGLSDEFKEIYAASTSRIIGPVLYFCGPCEWMDPYRDARELFINTMWEADRLPAVWPERINLARALIVPSRFLVQVCRQSGVNIPVEVVAQGVDPEVYRYEERPEREGLTTLMVGTVDDRKHMDVGIAAWQRAFDGDASARLVIKSRFQKGNYSFEDKRIGFFKDNEVTRGIAHWYREADVLLALGNEGFGLPLVEAMATGLPCIALDSEGQADTCADARGLLLTVDPATWEVCEDSYWGRAGVRAVPGVEDVEARLRWVASHRDEAREMGRAASVWARAQRNVWEMGAKMLDVMELYSEPRRSLRHSL